MKISLTEGMFLGLPRFFECDSPVYIAGKYYRVIDCN